MQGFFYALLTTTNLVLFQRIIDSYMTVESIQVYSTCLLQLNVDDLSTFVEKFLFPKPKNRFSTTLYEYEDFNIRLLISFQARYVSANVLCPQKCEMERQVQVRRQQGIQTIDVSVLTNQSSVLQLQLYVWGRNSNSTEVSSLNQYTLYQVVGSLLLVYRGKCVWFRNLNLTKVSIESQ